MPNLSLKRNRYSEPPFSEGDFSARHFDEDFQEYHLPLARLQLASFQEHGVAQGLEVSGTPGDTAITVHPGVAVDGSGQLISLSTEGKADIGTNPFNEEHEEVDVPVQLELGDYSGADTSTAYYVTIQFSELLRFEEGPLGRFEHAPWVRLQAVSGEDAYVDDGAAVVLARIEIDSDGRLTELQPTDRRIAGKVSGTSEVPTGWQHGRSDKASACRGGWAR